MEQELVTSSGKVRDVRPPNLILLLGTVLVSGAAVMIYEFLVVRILARHFGGALEVWASVISVLLAGLCLGYALGGWLADRYGTATPVAWALGVAGVLGLVTERIAVAVGDWLLTIDTALPLHPYVSAFATSFFPIVALGTVLPQMIRLRAQQMGRVGAAAGWTSGLSTLGSILGVMLTVHVLLPHIRVSNGLYATSGVLILNALLLAAPRWRRGAVIAVVLLGQADASAQVRYENYSAYHHIIVRDVSGRRLMQFDNAVQTLMSLRNVNQGGFEYTDFFHVPVLLKPEMERVLFLGLGGGTGPKAFLQDYPDVEIRVVEIDPVVEDLARKYFYLPKDPRLRVTIRDARVYLQRSRAQHDAIIMDAYASSRFGAYLPQHLATREFFELARERLTENGSLVYNVASETGEEEGQLATGIYATLKQVFAVVYVFDAKSSFNTVFVAQKREPLGQGEDDDAETVEHEPEPYVPLTGAALKDRASRMLEEGRIKHGILPERVTQFSPLHGATPTGPVYTDDYAPVDMGRARR